MLFALSGILVSGALNDASSLHAESPFLPHRLSPLKGIERAPVRELQNTFRQIYELYRRSVVYIRTDRKDTDGEAGIPAGVGTGFFISSDGYVCTNHHVVADAGRVEVVVSGQVFSAVVVGMDEFTDLALLKVENSGPFESFFAGDSEKVQVGDWAIAIGNPFGLERSFTLGVVSSVSRSDLDQPGNNHIQTDASIHPGNSGGPLINIDGEVIGVNRMIYSGPDGGGGIAFAIPINEALRVLTELRERGHVRRGFLGVQIGDEGALVSSVLTDSPAAKAGIKPGDRIRTVDGKPVRNFRELLRLVGPMAPGRIVEVEIDRAGKTFKLKVELTERPQSN